MGYGKRRVSIVRLWTSPDNTTTKINKNQIVKFKKHNSIDFGGLKVRFTHHMEAGVMLERKA
ncbi:hypothetical protein FORC54_2867 [Vibrio vulnificus]|nr:hypothetical protein FORC54_2867 [Vibrio vulnificus]